MQHRFAALLIVLGIPSFLCAEEETPREKYKLGISISDARKLMSKAFPIRSTGYYYEGAPSEKEKQEDVFCKINVEDESVSLYFNHYGELIKVLKTVSKVEKSAQSEEGDSSKVVQVKEPNEFEDARKDVADLDKAVDESPAHYIAPDPEIVKRLKKKITFSALGRPLRQCLEYLSEQARVLISCDQDFDGAPMFTVDVKDESIEDILKAMMKQTRHRAQKLDFLVRGRAVLVSTTERIEKLKKKPKEKDRTDP